MADCYKNPSLCNYYCSHECPIGQECVPEVQMKDLSQITLEMLASLNTLNRDKDRLIEITVDGQISADELNDFHKIQAQLGQIFAGNRLSAALGAESNHGRNNVRGLGPLQLIYQSILSIYL